MLLEIWDIFFLVTLFDAVVVDESASLYVNFAAQNILRSLCCLEFLLEDSRLNTCNRNSFSFLFFRSVRMAAIFTAKGDCVEKGMYCKMRRNLAEKLANRIYGQLYTELNRHVYSG